MLTRRRLHLSYPYWSKFLVVSPAQTPLTVERLDCTFPQKAQRRSALSKFAQELFYAAVCKMMTSQAAIKNPIPKQVLGLRRL